MRLLLKSSFLVLFICFLRPVNRASAQGIELGLLLGASNYMGDLSNDGIVLGETHPAAGIFGRYNLGEKWALKGYVGYGRISGTDQNANTDLKKSRNLSFYTDLYEASLQLEFNLVRNSVRYSQNYKRIVPYVFVGIGVFNYNPKADLNGSTFELQPLGTEGQGTTNYNDRSKYGLTQPVIPFGIGFRKKLSQRWSIGVELGARYTFTNYLDDIGGTYAEARVVGRAYGANAQLLSDRSWELTPDGSTLFKEGDPRSIKKIDMNDLYFTGGITLTYIFPNTGMRCPRF
jgi:hypothetical protein